MATRGYSYYTEKSQCVTKGKIDSRNIIKTEQRCIQSSETFQSCRTKGDSYSGKIIKTEKKCIQSSETFQTSGMKGFKVEQRCTFSQTVKTPALKHDSRLKYSSTKALKPPPAVKHDAKHQCSTRTIKAPAVKHDTKPKSSTQVVKSPAKRKSSTQIVKAPAAKHNGKRASSSNMNVVINNFYLH